MTQKARSNPEAVALIEEMLPAGKLAFTTKELSVIFDIRIGCFEEWRSLKSGGPSFTKVGRFVRYPRKAVVAWGVKRVTVISQ